MLTGAWERDIFSRYVYTNFGDEVKNDRLREHDAALAEWSTRWEKLDTPWAVEGADKELFELHDTICNSHGVSFTADAFVPLCGDSPSVEFLYRKGHAVTAIDISTTALERMIEHSFPEISFTKVEGDVGACFQANRLALYQADIFKWIAPKQYSFIYDRAALVAIDPALRTAYFELLLSWLRPGGVLFLITFDADVPESVGPPYPVRALELEASLGALEVIVTKSEGIQEIPRLLLAAGATQFTKRLSIFRKPLQK